MLTTCLLNLLWPPRGVSSRECVRIHTHPVLCYACPPLVYPPHPLVYPSNSCIPAPLEYPRPSPQKGPGTRHIYPHPDGDQAYPLEGTWDLAYPTPHFVNKYTHVKILPFYCFTVADGNNVLQGKYWSVKLKLIFIRLFIEVVIIYRV